MNDNLTDRADAPGFILQVSIFVICLVSCAACLSADYIPDRETFSKWDKKKLLNKTAVEIDSRLSLLESFRSFYLEYRCRYGYI